MDVKKKEKTKRAYNLIKLPKEYEKQETINRIQLQWWR